MGRLAVAEDIIEFGGSGVERWLTGLTGLILGVGVALAGGGCLTQKEGS